VVFFVAHVVEYVVVIGRENGRCTVGIGVRRGRGEEFVVGLFFGEGLEARFEGEVFRGLYLLAHTQNMKDESRGTYWLRLRRRRRNVHLRPPQERIQGMSVPNLSIL
jgi:hypothetical protein